MPMTSHAQKSSQNGIAKLDTQNDPARGGNAWAAVPVAGGLLLGRERRPNSSSFILTPRSARLMILQELRESRLV